MSSRWKRSSGCGGPRSNYGLTKTGGARHILGFTDLVEQQGRLNEAIMPLKVVGFAPRGFLRILPLGIKMFLKGKIPNPFRTSRSLGSGHLQVFIRRVRRATPSRPNTHGLDLSIS